MSSTLEGLQRELEAIRAKQNDQNPMDVSSSMDTVTKLNCAKQKSKEEKCLVEERLVKAKADYEQALKDRNCEISMKIERIKNIWKSTVASQTIMLELCSLKEKQDKDTTDRKVRKKALLGNIKASNDPILKSLGLHMCMCT